MGVHCRRCGREYDVALFQFGRTISCTCGTRVGLEPRVRPLRPAEDRRFVADAMLGRLARWLRLLGFDCHYDPAFTDATIAHLALTEGRTILTRDRRLPEEWWVGDLYVVRGERLRNQLAEVIEHFDLASSFRVLTRCSDCNRSLRDVARAEVSERVPPGVLERHTVFAECPNCRRVFWEGTHAGRIRALADAFVRARSCSSSSA